MKYSILVHMGFVALCVFLTGYFLGQAIALRKEQKRLEQLLEMVRGLTDKTK